MASMSLLLFSVLLSSLHTAEEQIVIGTSPSFSPLEAPDNSSPHPTKQTSTFWPSLPPRGRSDVPIRMSLWDGLTAANAVQQRMTRPSAPSSTISARHAHDLSRGPPRPQPTVSRPRTDTASLAFMSVTAKGSTPPPPASAVAAGDPQESVQEADAHELGSGSALNVVLMIEESLVPLPTVGDEMAQHRPQAQTAVSGGSETRGVDPLAAVDSETVEPQRFAVTAAVRSPMTPPAETRDTPAPLVTRHAEAVTGERTGFCRRLHPGH